MKRVMVEVLGDKVIAEWQGMGGAITEATAYNFAKLSAERQEDFLEAYYGKRGLRYNWGRVAIGSNDFCLTPYECVTKRNLKDFSLVNEERYILPMLRKIVKQKKLNFVASPWTPPSFMKTNRNLLGGGRLRRNYYKTYAEYLKRWLEAHEREGVKVKYITPQNEPRAAQEWESCLFDFKAQRRLIYKYLSKVLVGTKTKILAWDHNKGQLRRVAHELLDGGDLDRVAGLAFHWYDGIFAEQIWRTRQDFPKIELIATEMCCGFSEYDEDEWKNDAELYMKEIFADVNAGVNAWIDWNMLLDWRGGPSHIHNYVKSPVIMNETDDNFILTPIYKYLKKIAQFLPVESKVFRCETSDEDLLVMARQDDDGVKMLLYNPTDEEMTCEVEIGDNKKTKRVARHSFLEV